MLAYIKCARVLCKNNPSYTSVFYAKVTLQLARCVVNICAVDVHLALTTVQKKRLHIAMNVITCTCKRKRRANKRDAHYNLQNLANNFDNNYYTRFALACNNFLKKI